MLQIDPLKQCQVVFKCVSLYSEEIGDGVLEWNTKTFSLKSLACVVLGEEFILWVSVKR